MMNKSNYIFAQKMIILEISINHGFKKKYAICVTYSHEAFADLIINEKNKLSGRLRTDL